jgi:hypothetical protein
MSLMAVVLAVLAAGPIGAVSPAASFSSSIRRCSSGALALATLAVSLARLSTLPPMSPSFSWIGS